MSDAISKDELDFVVVKVSARRYVVAWHLGPWRVRTGGTTHEFQNVFKPMSLREALDEVSRLRRERDAKLLLIDKAAAEAIAKSFDA